MARVGTPDNNVTYEAARRIVENGLRRDDSLRLARMELDRQLVATTHERRKAQLNQAIAEVDRRMKETEATMK